MEVSNESNNGYFLCIHVVNCRPIEPATIIMHTIAFLIECIHFNYKQKQWYSN